jgi:hypothetical protein
VAVKRGRVGTSCEGVVIKPVITPPVLVPATISKYSTNLLSAPSSLCTQQRFPNPHSQQPSPFEHPIPLKTRTFFNNPQLENLAEKDEEEEGREEEDHLQLTAACCLLAGMMIRTLSALGRNHQTQLRTAAARLVGKLTVCSA